jgi:1,4-alpha-glucan branching enzyme
MVRRKWKPKSREIPKLPSAVFPLIQILFQGNAWSQESPLKEKWSLPWLIDQNSYLTNLKPIRVKQE